MPPKSTILFVKNFKPSKWCYHSDVKLITWSCKLYYNYQILKEKKIFCNKGVSKLYSHMDDQFFFFGRIMDDQFDELNLRGGETKKEWCYYKSGPAGGPWFTVIHLHIATCKWDGGRECLTTCSARSNINVQCSTEGGKVRDPNKNIGVHFPT